METVVIIAVIVACLIGWTLISLILAFVLGSMIARAKRANRQAEIADLQLQDAGLARVSDKARAAA